MKETNVLTIRLPPEVKAQLNQKAASEHLNVSDLVRRYIDKGLNIEGYKTEIDFLTDIMQTVLSGIVNSQTERIVKLIIKLGKINGAGYFLQLVNSLEGEEQKLEEVSETVRRCNRLAIDFMSQKDSDVDRFLQNSSELLKEALKIKNEPYGFDMSIFEEE